MSPTTMSGTSFLITFVKKISVLFKLLTETTVISFLIKMFTFKKGSGYRTKSHIKAVGGAVNSQHLTANVPYCIKLNTTGTKINALNVSVNSTWSAAPVQRDIEIIKEKSIVNI